MTSNRRPRPLVPTSSHLVPDEPHRPRPLVPAYRDEDEGRTPETSFEDQDEGRTPQSLPVDAALAERTRAVIDQLARAHQSSPLLRRLNGGT